MISSELSDFLRPKTQYQNFITEKMRFDELERMLKEDEGFVSFYENNELKRKNGNGDYVTAVQIIGEIKKQLTVGNSENVTLSRLGKVDERLDSTEVSYEFLKKNRKLIEDIIGTEKRVSFFALLQRKFKQKAPTEEITNPRLFTPSLPTPRRHVEESFKPFDIIGLQKELNDINSKTRALFKDYLKDFTGTDLAIRGTMGEILYGTDGINTIDSPKRESPRYHRSGDDRNGQEWTREAAEDLNIRIGKARFIQNNFKQIGLFTARLKEKEGLLDQREGLLKDEQSRITKEREDLRNQRERAMSDINKERADLQNSELAIHELAESLRTKQEQFESQLSLLNEKALLIEKQKQQLDRDREDFSASQPQQVQEAVLRCLAAVNDQLPEGLKIKNKAELTIDNVVGKIDAFEGYLRQRLLAEIATELGIEGDNSRVTTAQIVKWKDDQLKAIYRSVFKKEYEGEEGLTADSLSKLIEEKITTSTVHTTSKTGVDIQPGSKHVATQTDQDSISEKNLELLHKIRELEQQLAEQKPRNSSDYTIDIPTRTNRDIDLGNGDRITINFGDREKYEERTRPHKHRRKNHTRTASNKTPQRELDLKERELEQQEWGLVQKDADLELRRQEIELQYAQIQHQAEENRRREEETEKQRLREQQKEAEQRAREQQRERQERQRKAEEDARKLQERRDEEDREAKRIAKEAAQEAKRKDEEEKQNRQKERKEAYEKKSQKEKDLIELNARAGRPNSTLRHPQATAQIYTRRGDIKPR